MKRLTLSVAIIIFYFAGIQNTYATGLLNLEDYRGKVLYLDFWASWCVPCRASFPWMNKMHAQYPDDLAVVAINIDTDEKEIEKFLKKFPADFPIIYDPQGVLASKYGILGMPTSIIFDRESNLISQKAGFFKKKIPEYEEEIQQVMNKE